MSVQPQVWWRIWLQIWPNFRSWAQSRGQLLGVWWWRKRGEWPGVRIWTPPWIQWRVRLRVQPNIRSWAQSKGRVQLQAGVLAGIYSQGWLELSPRGKPTTPSWNPARDPDLDTPASPPVRAIAAPSPPKVLGWGDLRRHLTGLAIACQHTWLSRSQTPVSYILLWPVMGSSETWVPLGGMRNRSGHAYTYRKVNLWVSCVIYGIMRFWRG